MSVCVCMNLYKMMDVREDKRLGERELNVESAKELLFLCQRDFLAIPFSTFVIFFLVVLWFSSGSVLLK